MINEAERTGQLQPGGTIIEATAGNTGLGLAPDRRPERLFADPVVPDKMSREKIFHLRALGARGTDARTSIRAIPPITDYARRLASELPGAFYIDQFNNEANPLAHRTTTAPELFEQLNGRIDAIVVGVIRRHAGWLQACLPNTPHTEFVPADPAGSVLADRKPDATRRGPSLVEGIGEDFIPPLAHIDGVNRAAHHRPRRVRHGARAAENGRHSGRLLQRNPAGSRAEVLPGTDHAETRGDLRLRQRQQIPLKDVQR